MTSRPLLAALLLAAAFAACHSKAPAPVAKPDDQGGEAALFSVSDTQEKRLEVVTVTHQPVSRPLSAPALVAFDDLRTTDVTPLVSGNVTKVLVREGDTVTAGQSLLVISSPDSSDNTTNLERDKATLANKNAVLARDQDLYAHKAIALEELQGAQLDVDSAKAAVENDEAHINITGSNSGGAIVRSPIAGVIVSRTVSVGQAVQAGATTAFTITDPTAVWVVVRLYQEDLRRVEVGDAATIGSPVLDASLPGKVVYIGASIEPDSLTIPVRISAANPGGLLKKGMFVDAAIMPAKPDQRIVVPLSSVLRDADNLPFVYVEAAPAKFARRHIELGDQLADGFSVTSGLDDGDRVLGEGAIFIQFADSLGSHS